MILIPNLLGLASLWVTGRDSGGVLGLEVRQNLLVPANWWIKRGMDLTMTLVVGICSLPVLAVAAAWITIVSPGASPFYCQTREGEGRRKISVWKLRTMYPNADRLLQQHLAENPARPRRVGISSQIAQRSANPARSWDLSCGVPAWMNCLSS